MAGCLMASMAVFSRSFRTPPFEFWFTGVERRLFAKIAGKRFFRVIHVRFFANSGKKYSDARAPPFFRGYGTFLYRHVSSPP